MKKCWEKSPANHITWISIVLSNIMHLVSCSHSFANNSYSHTPSTHVTAPGLSCRDVVRFEKRNLKIVNSSNDDRCWGWAAGRRRRNLAWIWLCQHLNLSLFEWYVTKKVFVCEMDSWTGVCTQSALLNVDTLLSTLTGMFRNALRNILPIFLLLFYRFPEGHPAQLKVIQIWGRVKSDPTPFTLPHPTSTNSGSGVGARWRLCLRPYLRGQLDVVACRI